MSEAQEFDVILLFESASCWSLFLYGFAMSNKMDDVTKTFILLLDITQNIYGSSSSTHIAVPHTH